MTQTTKEILEKYQVRKSKKQKTAFINYTEQVAKSYGYDVKVEKGDFGARNIVIGNPDTAKVLYTAHYDTCARLPFPNFITPKNFAIYLLYQLMILVFCLAAVFLLRLSAELIFSFIPVKEEVARTVQSILLQFGCLFVLFLFSRL